MPLRVLFVCTGNICRSPMAEGLARQLAAARGLDLAAGSAGTIARDGQSATDHARTAMAARGVDIGGHQARRLRAELVAEADLVVAMEEEHRLAVREMPGAAGKAVLLLSEWAGEPPLGPGIADPIGGDRGDYEHTAREIEAYITRALDRLAEPAGAAAREARMAVKKAEKIWMNGRLVDWDDAKIHILSHVVHYGSSVFEGIRVYKTPQGPVIFRLDEHVQRLLDSAKIYRMVVPFSFTELRDAMLETVLANRMEECYIRPVVYRGYGNVGVDPRGCPIDVAIAVWEWGKYLGPEALEQGVDVCVSSWNRCAPNTMPNMAKAGSNYMNSQLIKQEAIVNGYVEGIGLDIHGYVSEGSGENLFLVRDGMVYTTPIHGSILVGITRNSIITLLGEMGYEIKEAFIPREMLYLADEVFFTGSASEVTPIRSIDRITVGEGKRGSVAKQLQDRFFGMFDGRQPDRYGWLTLVKPAAVGK